MPKRRTGQQNKTFKSPFLKKGTEGLTEVIDLSKDDDPDARLATTGTKPVSKPLQRKPSYPRLKTPEPTLGETPLCESRKSFPGLFFDFAPASPVKFDEETGDVDASFSQKIPVRCCILLLRSS